MWDYGTGQLGNNGIHFMDIARWGLNLGYPNFVASGGGRIHFDSDMETPDTHIVTFEFPGDKLIVWEHRIWSKRGIDGLGGGIEFYGEL